MTTTHTGTTTTPKPTSHTPARAPISVLVIAADGALAVEQVPPHRDAIAGLLGGRDLDDVRARFCWPMDGGNVTAWTTISGGDVNTAAQAAIDKHLPVPTPGLAIPDRARAQLVADPLRGAVVLAGYDARGRCPVSLHPATVERFRRDLDGRTHPTGRPGGLVVPPPGATTVLPALPATTTLPTAAAS